MQQLIDFFTQVETGLQAVLSALHPSSGIITFIFRFIFPPIALFVFFRCLMPLMSGGRQPRPWAYLALPNGLKMPLTHWENSIGRAKSCDIVLEVPSVSRTHAVITRKKSHWFITDLHSTGGVRVNDEECSGLTPIQGGDKIELAGVELYMIPAIDAPDKPEVRHSFAERAARLARKFKPGTTMLYIFLFQLLGLIEISLAQASELSLLVPTVFLLFMLLEWMYYLFTRSKRRRYIEPELLAFFLCGIGLFGIATANPVALFKQFATILLGLAFFLVLTYALNNTARADKARYALAIGAIALLGLNLILAPTRFGARNWIHLGPISIQPSEFIKVAFVFVGATTLDKLLTKQSLLRFIVFSAICVGAFAFMRDFGAALVFFTAFIVISFMRSGDVRMVGIMSAVAATGAFLAFTIMPYVQKRFAAWGHVWEVADAAGYQQTRTMIYTASGGMFGVGSGNGFLRYVAAADTDLVFGLVAEEWGLIIALICALTPLALALYAFMSVKAGRSSFYAISACGAAMILLMQAALNVFGSLDILPLTGVTLPFVSNGGSSMVACWGLLACIKSVDERHRAQNLPDSEVYVKNK